MKQVMTFQQAALDPNRPLSITPREWMYAVQAQMAKEKQLVDNTVIRLAAQQNKDIKSIDGLEKIEMGIDQIVEGIKIVSQGLLDAQIANLNPKEREIVNKVKDLIETAVSPYTVDIIEQLDKLEDENE